MQFYQKKELLLLVNALLELIHILDGFPVKTNLIALGTLNHNSPVAIPVAISVVPTPVENAPKAP